MKLYESKETTPLKFYNFYRNVLLPLGIVYSSITVALAVYVMFSKTFNGYLIFICALDIFDLLLGLFIFVGLVKWKRYTVTFVLISLIRNILDVLVYVYALTFNSPGNVRILIFIIIIDLVICFVKYLIFIYFYKRKNLLDGVSYKIPAHTEKQRKMLMEYFVENNFKNQEVADDNRKRCECGYPILYPEYTSCPDCGKEYKIMSQESRTDEAL